MRELPTGTVTFLFTDIEGSTRLLQELGDRYAEVLAEHRRLLRAAFDRHGGVEVDTQGDAFFIAFARAKDALAAAAEGQQALVGGPIRVRMGVHTGEPVVTAEGYVGIDVHRAARICSAAYGGQVVLSARTHQLLDGDLELRDLGLHRLKDLTRPEKIFQLGDDEFPPLRSLNATNLPVQPTPLVGRERELAETLALLRRGDVRLLTLVGTGGAGKTRLALQIAAELIEEFRDGVFWVSLAALSDPGLVLPTIAQPLGVREQGSEPLAQTLKAHIDAKRILLLLDNFEQVVAAAPALADLLARCPNLRLLVTTRAVLRLSAEHEYDVPPLPKKDAISLFRERARTLDPGFEPDEAVGEICRRLDGLPLAIELAAVRIRVLPPERLLARLEQRLPLLTGGARDLPARQQTLRSTIEWSHGLLGPEEQRLFARVAVFAGSFDIEAAEEVCAANFATLESLIEQSLVRRAEGGRSFMLETIREYALSRLEESGEREELRRRHAAYFLKLAEAAAPQVKAGDHQTASLERLDREHGNLRAALASFDQLRETELQLRLAAALGRFWYLRGHLTEGRRWLEDALARGSDQPRRLRAQALTGASYLALAGGDAEGGAMFAQERLELYRELGDTAGVAEALNDLGWAAALEGDYERARELQEESMRLFRAVGDSWGLAISLNNLGNFAWVAGEYERAVALCGESAAISREIGDKHLVATALCSGGYAHLYAARADESAAMFRESLRLAGEIGEKAVVYRCLDTLAAISVSDGDGDRAARLLGGAEAVMEVTGASLEPAERELHERTVAALREQLAEQSIRKAWTEGREMTLEQAIAYALETTAESQPEPVDGPG